MPGYPSFAYSIYPRHDGHNLAYKVLGTRTGTDKTPLVLVHGLSAVGLVDWLPLATTLAKSRPVLIFDNRNIGGSTTTSKEKGDQDYTMQDQADDVVDLVKHVGWKEIDILGFSMGGMIVQTLLVTPRLPFKVRHAVLAATSAKAAHSDLLAAIPDPSRLPKGRPPTDEEKRELIREFVYTGYDPKFVADPKNKKLLDQRIEESIQTRRPAKTITRQLSTIASYDVRKKLHLLPSTLPVLVIHGKKDRSVYFSERKYIEKLIPHAQYAKLPDEEIGHMWYDYFTIEFWDRLLGDFLDDREAMNVPGKGKKGKL